MTVAPPPDTTNALGACRLLPSGEAVGYTVMEADSWRLIERTVRMAAAVGYVTEARDDSYAIIDVYDDTGIIADYGVPHARAWRWWYRKCGFRVSRADQLEQT